MALSSVDCTVPHRNLIPQKGCGYMFPDPGYFAVLDNEKREAAIAAWLSTRPTRCGQMLHPFQGPMPVASSMTWRKFFWIFATRWQGLTDLGGTSQSQASGNTSESVLNASTAACAMFGPQLVATMNLEMSEVHFHSHSIPIVNGCAKGITPVIMRQIIWEMAELNW